MIKKSFLLAGLLLYFICFSYIDGLELKLKKKFELGSENKKEEIFFRIMDVRADRYGNIFILDGGNHCIKKFSKEGKFIKETGRKGQGPGEFSYPSNLDFDSKDNIYVNDFGNRRVNVYDNNLNFLKIIKFELKKPFQKLFIDTDGNLLMLHFPLFEGEKFFYLFSSNGKLINSFFEQYHPYYVRIKSKRELPSIRSNIIYTFAEAGINFTKSKIAFTYVFPENPYKIYFLDLKGKIIQIIKKKIKGYNPQKQREYWKLNRKERATRHLKSLKSIVRVIFTKENYLIIQRRDEIYKNGTFERFKYSLDIFSPEGDLVKEEMKFNGDILSIDHKNNVYVRTEDEQGTPKVVVYSLKIEK